MQPIQIYITKHRAGKENPKPLKDKKKIHSLIISCKLNPCPP